jgi:hypothetical protein
MPCTWVVRSTNPVGGRAPVVFGEAAAVEVATSEAVAAMSAAATSIERATRQRRLRVCM